MSRAPAPMKTDTPAPTMDAVAMNPYGMQPYSMPGPATNSAIQSMQNMYGNMQLQQMPPQYPTTQQPMQHQQSFASMPNTMQNVSVVDFKAGLLTQQHVAQMQQQYQNTLNATAAAPSLGLIGADGRYIPATAATPMNGMTGSSFDHGMTGSSFDHGRFSESYPHTASPVSYNPHTAATPRQLDFDQARYRNSVSSSMAADRMRSERMSARASAQNRVNSTNSRAMKDMIDQSVRASTAAANAASMTNSRALKDMIDQSVRASTAAANAASMTNSRAMTDLIDERVRASTAAAVSVSTPSVTNSRAMKDLIDERVRRGLNSMPTPQPVVVQSMVPASVVPTIPTASGFHAKPLHEQTRIVGEAVRSVMKDYNVTPKINSPYNTTVPNTASPFSDRRLAATASPYTDRARYERHDAF
ncbi:hypothetical protein T484DRAFT_1757047 [Baffinella frigidus]|nr:hypothetical protein T484DRAFT_1757047 [Cryptophyta sp. CCMP2293]